MPISLPMPMPTLTRLHSLSSEEEAIVERFDEFIEEYVALVVLGEFERAELILQNANQLCLQDGAHPKQRVLWVKEAEQVAALRPKIEALIQKKYPDHTIDFDNIRAVTVAPNAEKVSYIMYANPRIANDPEGRPKRLSILWMAIAFNQAILDIPNPELESEIESEDQPTPELEPTVPTNPDSPTEPENPELI